MIKKLIFIDFDGTLSDSPTPESGKIEWEKFYNKEFPHLGWWSKLESLDLNVFDIKLFSNILNILKKGISESETYTVILTSRMEKMRPHIEKILNVNNINVDEVNLKSNVKSKGQKILEYIEKFPNVKQIDVFDDNYEREIVSFLSIKNDMPKNIKFNIYHVQNNVISLVESNYKILNIILDEIKNKKYLHYM